MPKKKPYFPNNWRAIKDAPEDIFISMPFEQLMEWKLDGYQIPSSINCIMRVTSLSTGKIEEHVYTNERSAKRKLVSMLDEDKEGYEFAICAHDTIHHIFPKGMYEEDEHDLEIDEDANYD